jgi:hypothetical protein
MLFYEIKSIFPYTRLEMRNIYLSSHGFLHLGIMNAPKSSIYSLVKLFL